MIYHDVSIFGFFCAGNSNFLDFIWLVSKFRLAEKKQAFHWLILNSFAPIFGALNSSENFDAMNVRRDAKSPIISHIHYGEGGGGLNQCGGVNRKDPKNIPPPPPS